MANCPHSDDFMMNTFKVELCMLSHPHIWKTCPYVHPGEPIKRRPHGSHHHDLCPDVKKGRMCSSGPERCSWAHNTFESWLHPQRYRTIMCRDGAKCNRSICFFAHSQAQLRRPQPADKPSSPPASTGMSPHSSALLTRQQQPQLFPAPTSFMPLELSLSQPSGFSTSSAGMTPCHQHVATSTPLDLSQFDQHMLLLQQLLLQRQEQQEMQNTMLQLLMQQQQQCPAAISMPAAAGPPPVAGNWHQEAQANGLVSLGAFAPASSPGLDSCSNQYSPRNTPRLSSEGNSSCSLQQYSPLQALCSSPATRQQWQATDLHAALHGLLQLA